MKRTFLAVVMIATAALGGSPAYAEPAAPLSNDQLTQIKQNCVRVKSTLRRIHANDGLVRVNQGQQYEVIATRLMAPLNSRIALNRLDGVELAKTTVEYNTQLTAFRSEYRQYEEKLSELLRTDCTDQPVEFYYLIKPVRERRKRVADVALRLNQLLSQYGSQFDVFYSKQFPAKKEVPSAQQPTQPAQ